MSTTSGGELLDGAGQHPSLCESCEKRQGKDKNKSTIILVKDKLSFRMQRVLTPYIRAGRRANHNKNIKIQPSLEHQDPYSQTPKIGSRKRATAMEILV